MRTPRAISASVLLGMSCAALAADEPCTRAEHRQFDFWLGDWDVFRPDGELAGVSHIERIADGCGISEHWQGAKGSRGVSYNAWDAGSGKWRQFWIGNTSGDVLYLVSGLRAGSMVLEGMRPDPESGEPQRQRITWTARDDGSVRQLWESADAAGTRWATEFEGTYRRRRR